MVWAKIIIIHPSINNIDPTSGSTHGRKKNEPIKKNILPTRVILAPNTPCFAFYCIGLWTGYSRNPIISHIRNDAEPTMKSDAPNVY